MMKAEKRTWTEEEIELAVRLWREGVTSPEIGRQLGRSRQQVTEKLSRLRRNQGIDLPRRPRPTAKKPDSIGRRGRRVFWTEGRLARLRLLAERGWSHEDIAEDLGATVWAVADRLRPPPQPRAIPLRKWTPAERRKALLLRSRGLSAALIGREIGRASSSIYAMFRALGAAGEKLPPRVVTERLWSPGPPARDLTAHMKAVSLKRLENAIIKPGFEKHLEPLLYYRGRYSLGRAHRMYNFVVAAMLCECESVADMTQRLAMNPKFSHLLGPSARPAHGAIRAFYGRLMDNPSIARLTPGLWEFIHDTAPTWTYPPPRLPAVTHDPRVRWAADGGWRQFVPLDGKGRSAKPLDHMSTRLASDYPFLIHDAGQDEHRLSRLVNTTVPRWLPPDMRADVCQDLIVGILCGDFTEDDLAKPLKETLTKVRKLYPGKWGNVSLDSVIPGTENLRLIDTISEGQGLWENA